MDLSEKREITEDMDGGIRKRVILYYPYAEGEGKAAKRVNGFVFDLIQKIKKDAAKAPFVYIKLTYKMQNPDPLSLFFELESYGAGGEYSYTPLSAVFDINGRAAPYHADKKEIKQIKRHFKDRGVRFTKKDCGFAYYIKDGKAVFYAAQKSNGRAKKSIITFEASAF